MSDKNLEQRINFKVCVKFGKSASVMNVKFEYNSVSVEYMSLNICTYVW